MATATLRRQTRNVLEYAAARPGRVDRERGIIAGVKIVGLTSSNGGRYSPEALRRAVPLYEGAHVFSAHPERSHPDAERSPADMLGWLESVRFVEGDGLRADFHYLKSHQSAGQIVEVAERRPDRLGFSHNAVVTESGGRGELVYESIERVRSVDLVCRPATTRGIFESQEVAEMVGDDPSFMLLVACVRPVWNSDRTPAEKATEIARIGKIVADLGESLAKIDSEQASADEGESDRGPRYTDADGAIDPKTGKPLTRVEESAGRRRDSREERFERAAAILEGRPYRSPAERAALEKMRQDAYASLHG